MKISTRKLASAAVVGAAYAALTLLLAPISFGLVQLRVSEALCHSAGLSAMHGLGPVGGLRYSESGGRLWPA